jgi:hypothetical protein
MQMLGMSGPRYPLRVLERRCGGIFVFNAALGFS